MARRASFCAVLALGSLPACSLSPTWDVSGTWASRYGHSGAVVLVLQQNGDTISGVSCEFESGQRIYSGAPVHGEFPRLEFTIGAARVDACCPFRIGMKLSGAVVDRRQIAGAWTSANGQGKGDVLDFRREDGTSCPAPSGQ